MSSLPPLAASQLGMPHKYLSDQSLLHQQLQMRSQLPFHVILHQVPHVFWQKAVLSHGQSSYQKFHQSQPPLRLRDQLMVPDQLHQYQQQSDLFARHFFQKLVDYQKPVVVLVIFLVVFHIDLITFEHQSGYQTATVADFRQMAGLIIDFLFRKSSLTYPSTTSPI